MKCFRKKVRGSYPELTIMGETIDREGMYKKSLIHHLTNLFLSGVLLVQYKALKPAKVLCFLPVMSRLFWCRT